MMEFALEFLTQTKTLAPAHFIKLSRHMVKTLKSSLIKSTHEYWKTAMNSESTPDQTQAAFDTVFHLTGMVHFYINGLDPITKGENEGETMESFLKVNQQEIYKRALLYCTFDV
jgi:hypothetical protein